MLSARRLEQPKGADLPIRRQGAYVAQPRLTSTGLASGTHNDDPQESRCCMALHLRYGRPKYLPVLSLAASARRRRDSLAVTLPGMLIGRRIRGKWLVAHRPVLLPLRPWWLYDTARSVNTTRISQRITSKPRPSKRSMLLSRCGGAGKLEQPNGTNQLPGEMPQAMREPAAPHWSGADFRGSHESQLCCTAP
jgi:hypothetical protein